MAGHAVQGFAQRRGRAYPVLSLKGGSTTVGCSVLPNAQDIADQFKQCVKDGFCCALQWPEPKHEGKGDVEGNRLH